MSRSGLSLRSPLAVLPLVALLTLAPVASAAVLEVYSDSLTTYLPSSASAVQDVRPLAIQRAVHLDGTLVGGSTFDLQIAGNPFGSPWNENRFHGDIRLDIGAYMPTDIDIALPATVPWVIGRTYNGRQTASGGSARHSNGYQGIDWFQTSQPEIVLYEHVSDDTQDVAYVLLGGDRYIELERLDDGEETPTAIDLYKAVNGAAGMLEFVEGGADVPDLFIFTSQDGTVLYFWGFDADADPAQGQLWKIVGTGGGGGDVAFVGHATTMATALSNGYDADGRIVYAEDSRGNEFEYAYSTLDSVKRLTSVEVTYSSTVVARVDYEYYTGSSAYGADGNLKLVRRTVPLSPSGVSVEYEKLYHYADGMLILVVGEEGTRRYDWEQDGDLSDDDFESADAEALAPYADLYMTFDGSNRIESFFTTGACGCGGQSSGWIDVAYGLQAGHPGSAGYDEERYSYALLTHPDGHRELQWCDKIGGPLTKVIWLTTNPFDTDGSAKTWIQHVERYATSGSNPGGSIAYITKPSACGGWNNTNATYSVNLSALVNAELAPYSGGNELDGQPNVFQPNQSATRTTALTAANALEFASGLLTFDLVRPRVTTRTDELGNVTAYGYTYYGTPGAELREQIVEITHPFLSDDNNGPEDSLTSFRYMRTDGTLAFTQSTDGDFDYTRVEEGLVTERRRDALLTGSFPSGDDPNGDFGITEGGGGLNLVTTFSHDLQGRVTGAVLPTSRETVTYYTRLEDGRLVTLSIPRKASTTFYGPVSYTVTNHAGRVEGQGVIALDGGSTTTALSSWISTSADEDPIAAINGAVGTLERWSTTLYNKSGTRAEERRAYFDIPASGVGDATDNYDPTLYEYDDSGRMVREEDATGTITATVYDAIGRAIETWVGTDDSGGGGDNMVRVSAVVYDGGADDKDSLVTLRTLYVQDGDTGKREFAYQYDTLNRTKIIENPLSPHELLKYDAANRVIARGLYSDTANITTGSDPTSVATDRLALTTVEFDEAGREFRRTTREVDPGDGSLGGSLVTERWFDEGGRLAKIDGPKLAKFAYSRDGLQTVKYVLASDNDTDYASATGGVTGDKVLLEIQTYRSPTSRSPLMEVQISRFHDDTSSTGPLDIDSDLYLVDQTGTPGSTAINGRVQITSTYEDAWGRPEYRVALGTYGGSSYDRVSASSPPSPSDTELVTVTAYDGAGSVSQVTDPAGIITAYVYDGQGRQTTVIENYVDGTPGDDGGDDDRTITYGYTDGLRTTYVANLPGGNQTTTYSYDASASSTFASNRLLTEIAYPDSGGASDVVSIGYNAQGQIISIEDQAGNIVETDYDTAGRRTARRVTNVATGFDDAVLAIRTAFGADGRVSTVTQYDDASSTSSGDVVDQVQFSWDGWGELEHLDHDFNGEIGTDYWRVTYVREAADGGRNALRITQQKLLYAGSTEKQKVEYTYGTGGSMDDDLSRVTAVSKYAGGSPVTLVEYDYLGPRLVGINYDEPTDTVFNRFYDGTTGSYPGLDRFNRVVSDVWSKDVSGGPIEFFNQSRAYDRMSNVTLIEDNVYAGRDAAYTYDDFNRLLKVDEGTWGGSSIGSQTRQEVWELDHAGNWDVNKLDLDGDLNYTDAGEFNVGATFNAVNEMTVRDSVNLAWDAMGNLTDDGVSYKFELDVFGRLRRVLNQSDELVAEFRYNGLNERISIQMDADGDGTVEQTDSDDDPSCYVIHGKDWQVVGICRSIDDGAGTEAGEYLAKCDDDPKELYVHHAAGLDGQGTASYIDALILRDADMNGNGGWFGASDGTPEQRLYACQDAHANVIALLDETGARVEGARYFAYGMPFGLPRSDCDADGDVDVFDVGIKNAAYGKSVGQAGYDVRADIDLDGDVDATDSGIVSGDFGQTLGRGALTRDPTLSGGVGNRFAYAGYMWEDAVAQFQVRHRWLDPLFGRLPTRDPYGNADGPSVYEYVRSRPIVGVDPSGLVMLRPIGDPIETNPRPGDVMCTPYHQLTPEGGIESGCGGSAYGSGSLESACIAAGPTCNWWEIAAGNNCASGAFRRTRDLFPGVVPHNNAADAFRHCYWMCCMVAYGVDTACAQHIGDCHELFNPNPADEVAMDQHNNSIGRSYGQACSGLWPWQRDNCCQDKCLQGTQNGDLITSPPETPL